MARSAIVIDRNGVEGTVLNPDDRTELVRVRLADGQTFLVPRTSLREEADREFHAPFRFSELQLEGLREGELERVVIPIVSETVAVERRTRETGRVRISKKVRETTEVVDEPIIREEVQVDRVPINRVIDQPVSEHYEGDTLIVPVLEETYVVEKRLVLKEELHIRKRRVESREPQEVRLRHEEVDVERVNPETKEQDVTRSRR